MSKKKMTKAVLKNKLVGMGFEPDLSMYISERTMHCIKNKIHPLDLILTKHVFPFMSEKFNKTVPAIEHELILSLHRYWNSENKNTVFKEFGYIHKPTIKKLMILILTNQEKLIG